MRNIRYLGFCLLLPLVVGVPLSEEDSAETNIRVSGGAGSYAYITRGCEGQVLTKDRIPFKDLGYSIDHKFKFPVRVGLRGGKIWEGKEHIEYKKMANSYINPNISFEWRKFGIGTGLFVAKRHLPHRNTRQWAKRLPSAHLRVGSPKFYFSIHMLENVPLYSGGGYLNLGFGGAAGRKTSYWIGLGASGPYDGTGFVAKTNFNLRKNWYLDLTGRLGGSSGTAEHAIAVGLNYRL